MNERNSKQAKEFMQRHSTKELQEMLEEYNTDLYKESTFALIREELQHRKENLFHDNPTNIVKKHNNPILAILMIMFCVAILVYTNPTLDDFSLFVKDQIYKEVVSNDPLFASFAGFIGSAAIKANTTSENYLLFTIFDVRSLGEEHKIIGVFKNFIPIH